MKTKFRHIVRVCTLLWGAALLHSCIKEPGGCAERPTRTVLVYLAGDNNLADIGRTPELLRLGWKPAGSNCLIYYDAPDAPPKLLELACGCDDPTPYIKTVAEYREENSAKAEVFGRVVRDVAESYPAKSYGLIFASHASGWLPQGTLSNPQRSVGSDLDAGDSDGLPEMELSAFAAAIPDHQFDFIIFEACLMAGVEVACELRNKTNYILASSAELLAPGYGMIYPSASQHLFDTRLDVPQALRRFATGYMTHVNALGGAYRSATQSIICTDGMDALAAFAAELFEGMSRPLDDGILEALQHFDRPGSYNETPARPRYFDLADYLTYIAPERQTEMEALLDRIVVWKASTPEFMAGQNGFAIRTHSGLTTYIEQNGFPGLNASYKQTSWWIATHK